MKPIDLGNDPYSKHLIGDCDIDCEFCREEESGGRKPKSQKIQGIRHNENKTSQRARVVLDEQRD